VQCELNLEVILYSDLKFHVSSLFFSTSLDPDGSHGHIDPKLKHLGSLSSVSFSVALKVICCVQDDSLFEASSNTIFSSYMHQ